MKYIIQHIRKGAVVTTLEGGRLIGELSISTKNAVIFQNLDEAITVIVESDLTEVFQVIEYDTMRVAFCSSRNVV